MRADKRVSEKTIERCRAGDDEAARELYERYAGQMLELAQQRISQRLASRIDPEDVVQSVFRTFFKRARGGDFTMHDQNDLCKILARITLNKTLRQIAHHRRAKRDALQETALDQTGKNKIPEVFSRGPTPEQSVIFIEQLELLLDGLSPEDQKICAMRLDGYKNTEIAKELGINERRIRRLMERLRGLAKPEDWLE